MEIGERNGQRDPAEQTYRIPPLPFHKKLEIEKRPTSMGSHLGGMHLAGIGYGVFAPQVSQGRCP